MPPDWSLSDWWLLGHSNAKQVNVATILVDHQNAKRCPLDTLINEGKQFGIPVAGVAPVRQRPTACLKLGVYLSYLFQSKKLSHNGFNDGP